VVGFPHPIKGNAIYAYITLNEGVTGTDALKKELSAGVAASVGRFAVPDKIQWAPALPKTRSGKIMRRILRKIADPTTFKVMKGGDLTDLGDTSTLADPTAVQDLINGAQHAAL
jgi:acetyl-CoA synthetase